MTDDPVRSVGPVSADFRIAVPVLIAWVVVGVGIGLPETTAVAAGIGWGSAVVSLIAALLLRRRGALIVIVLALAASSAAMTSAAARVDDRRPSVLLEAAASGRFLKAAATTTETVNAGTGSFTVQLTAVRIGDVTLRGGIPARVFGPPTETAMGIGTGIEVAGTAAATDPADDVAFLLFPAGPPRVHSPPPAALDWANTLRERFRDAASELPGDGGALLPGLAIGDTSAVGAELDAAMKVASLSHLTAVSGANCAVVVGLIMLGGRSIGLSRGWRIAASVTVLVGFVVLVTPEPSVLRAAVMVSIVLVAMSRGRPVRGVPVLSVAVIGLLLLDPWLARQYGFILSVLATAGLLVLAGPLTGRLSTWMPRPIAAVIAIPLAAQLACQSVLILLAPVVPTFGIVANVLAGPAAPIATVVGLASCVLLVVLPPVGAVAAQIAWLPSAWIAAVAGFFAAAPANRFPWIEGIPGVVALAASTVLLLIVVLGHGTGLRRIAGGILVVAVAGAIGVAAGTSIRTAVTRPGDWQYAVCDVGQGDAVLVRSGGRVALIDTGPDPALLVRCLDAMAVSRIDLLVLTHFDLDHVGGAAAVIDRVDVALVGPSDGEDADRLRRDLLTAGADVREVAAGERGVLGDLRWSVLWPSNPLRGTEPGNDASVAMAFDAVGTCGDRCLSSVFLGDLGEQQQARLLATSRMSPVDVVKVAHHGSSDQSQRLYEALDARVGLIGVGAENGYGHPTDRLLDILRSTGTAPARTDHDGLVLVAPGADDTIRVWSER